MPESNYPHILAAIVEKINAYSLISTAQILFSNQTNNWINKLLTNKIPIPTHLFCGVESVVPYQSVIYQRQFYPNSQIYIFARPKSSHFAWMENHVEFNELLNRFIFE